MFFPILDFLGRTEIRIQDILKEAGGGSGPRQPLVKHLVLHEVQTGEIVVKLDLHLFDQTWEWDIDLGL